MTDLPPPLPPPFPPREPRQHLFPIPRSGATIWLNLYLIGYVLATFNFGAVQAFVTQMAYGLILMASLLLTLLVPVIGRHISFISPWGAFVVLASVVIGIMLHVATQAQYLPADPLLQAAQGDFLTRYLLVSPAEAVSFGLSFSPIQNFAFLAAFAAVVLALAARLINAEARAKRMGLFLYIFVAVLIVALFAVIAGQGNFSLLQGGTP